VHPATILTCVGAYFAALLTVAWWTGRRADNAGYFTGNRRSPWVWVALGLIGDTLSGVSYISVPGKVATDHFGYLQLVLGYCVGYALIGTVLLPQYYRLRLTSIYEFLGQRFDTTAQRTGSGFFLVSRLLGSAARLYLAVTVFQTFVFQGWGVPFWVTAGSAILLILIYTLRGGIQTLVWTDLFQSGFLVLGVLLSIGALMIGLDWSPSDLVLNLSRGPETTVFNGDWRSPGFFWKQLMSGAALAVVMTGLDQNNMQKTLSCRTLPEAQKNLWLFTPIMVLVTVAILVLGALLFRFAEMHGIPVPARTDELFPRIALGSLGTPAAVIFVLGLTAATFNSADSVLTSLTTSFCVDFLGFEQRQDLSEPARGIIRRRVHTVFAGVLFATLLILRSLASQFAVIDLVLKLASYTYGPLLGLFSLGLATQIRISGKPLPWIAMGAIALCATLDQQSQRWFNGYRFGFELLLLNALLTAMGALVFARMPRPAASATADRGS
jgi:Na+/proline symporter